MYADCAHSGLRVACEIAGLFRSAIPLPGERALFDERPWNVRRGMIPDGSVATGHGPDRLLECKFLTGASPPTPKPTSSTRAGAGRWNAERVRCTATT